MSTESPGNRYPNQQELARFREEWRREVRERTEAINADASSSRKIRIVHAPSYGDVGDWQELPEDNSSGTATPQLGASSEVVTGTLHTATTPSGLFNKDAVPAVVLRALAVYKRAVDYEQRGELDEALLLYRQAFRMEPNVDRAYQTQEMLAAHHVAQTTSPDVVATSEAEKDVDQVAVQLQSLAIVKSGDTITGTIASIIQQFPEDVRFDPEEEEEPVHFNCVPEELIVSILRRMDHTTVERFAAVSRKARLLTLDPGIWRDLVLPLLKPPQVTGVDVVPAIITRYESDFRRIYIEHPRIRLDGVYIAVCHYIRQGLNENSWVNINHLVTYHRYLRFFPDGKVLSLLANEETPPAEVVHSLKPSLRKKGLFIGTWKLSDSVVTISNLVDASGRFPIPPAVTAAGADSFARYTFRMGLSLGSKPVGRWNKLELTTYDSVDLQTGNMSPVGSRHQRPFWFSKVKSFPPF